eukprot:COSAG06_NODE_6146_length_3087_cov_1.980254_1_plen_583_part_00
MPARTAVTRAKEAAAQRKQPNAGGATLLLPQDLAPGHNTTAARPARCRYTMPPKRPSPESPAQQPSEPPAVETPSPWRASLGGMSRSLSRFTEDAARELERTTQEAREALAQQTAAARDAYREREGGGRESSFGAALERTSSGVAALTARASEAAAAALAAASEIEVTFVEPGPLGLSFGSVGKTHEQAGVPKVVIEVEPGGAASRMVECPIVVGLELIKVQDYSCEQLSFSATLDLIRAGSRPLTLTFKRPHIFEKRPDWVDETDWDAALDVTGDKVSLPPHEPEPEPEPEPPPEPAPELGEVSVGMAVCVRPDAEAEAACLDAGVKWNPARRGRAGGAAGEISEVCEDGSGVKVQWVEEKDGGRVDTTNLKFPIAALQDAGWSPPPAAAATETQDQEEQEEEQEEEEVQQEESGGDLGVDESSNAAVPVPIAPAGLEPPGPPPPSEDTDTDTDTDTGAGAGGTAEEAAAAPLVDTSVEVIAAPTADADGGDAAADAAAAATEASTDADVNETSTEPAAPAPWGIAEAEAVLVAEHPTVDDCERAELLFADMLEASPGDAAAKAGLRSAAAAKRKAKRAGR